MRPQHRYMSVSKPIILLVDDEANQRYRMSAVLRRAGYRVIQTRDYQEASAVYLRFRDEIDMLLIDVSIPGQNGCELAKTAKAQNPGVKVLLMSGQAGAEVCRFYGISATDVHFLEKPFRPVDMLARVKYVLESAEPISGTASATGSV